MIKKGLVFFLLCLLTGLGGCLVKDEVSDNCLLNDQAIQKFISSDNAYKSFKVDLYTTYFKIIKTSNTKIIPTVGSQVSVKYVGKLLDGTVFDSVYKSKPRTFALNSEANSVVIPGFNEAIKQLQKEDTANFIMPSCVAYGASPNAYNGKIPAYAPLFFENVVLTDVRTEKQLIEDYLTNSNAYSPTGFVLADTASISPTGLYYIILKGGTGDFPVKGQTVTVAYKGFVIADGRVFDENPNSIGALSTYLPGIQEAILNTNIGGKALILMPSSLAYSTGSNGNSLVPGYTPVAFEITLISSR